MRLLVLLFIFLLTLALGCQDYDNTSTLNKELSIDDFDNPPLIDWEEKFINSNSLPQAPEAKYLEAEEGLKIAYRDWIPENWDGKGDIVLIIPQWDLHSAFYSLLGETLKENSIYTRVIDIRGTGLSVCQSANSCIDPNTTVQSYFDSYDYYTGKLGDCQNRQQHARDLNLHILNLQSLYPEAEINLVGHTNGVGILIRLVETTGMSNIKSAAFLSPYYHYEQPQNGKKEYNTDAGNEIPYNFDQVNYEVRLGAMGDAIRQIEEQGGHRFVLKNLIKPFDNLQCVYFTYNFMEAGLATAPYGFWDAFTKPLLWINASEKTGYDIDKAKIEYLQAPQAKEKDFLIIEQVTRYGLIWSRPLGETLVLWVKNPYTFNQ